MGFVLYILLGFACWMFYYNITKDILHPCGLFLLMWYASAGLSNLYLSDLQQHWDLLMHSVVISSGLSFFLGTLLFFTPKRYQIIPKEPPTNIFRISSRLLFLLAVSCFLLEWYINGFNLSLMHDLEGDAKQDAAIPGVHYGTLLLPLTAILSYYEIINRGKNFFSIGVLIFVIGIYSLIFGLSRGDLVNYVFAFLFISSRYKRLKVGKIVSILLLICAFTILIIFIRLPFETSIVYNTTENKYVSIFYSYIALNFENLNKLIHSGEEWHLAGNGSLRFFWTLVGAKEYFPVTEINTNEVFNARTYLYPFYHDYKFIGILVFPFLIGSIISLIYKVYKHNGNNYWIVVLAVLQKPIVFTFFGNYFFGEMVVMFPLLVAIFLAVISHYRLKWSSPLRSAAN